MPRVVKLNSRITPGINIHIEPKPKVGDVIEIRLETSIVLDDATNFQIVVKKPSSGSTTWPATQFEDRSQITYTTKPEDLSEPGTYYMQALVEWRGTGRRLHGDPAVLTVGEGNLIKVL